MSLKRKSSLDYMTLQLWLYLSSPVLSQISGETFLCSQPSDFNSCNSTKRPHSYTKLVSAKVINTLIPKFTRHFSLFNNLTWPVSKYNWKMLATCSFTKHSSICFCDTLLFCFFFFLPYLPHHKCSWHPAPPIPLPWNGLSHLHS